MHSNDFNVQIITHLQFIFYAHSERQPVCPACRTGIDVMFPLNLHFRLLAQPQPRQHQVQAQLQPNRLPVQQPPPPQQIQPQQVQPQQGPRRMMNANRIQPVHQIEQRRSRRQLVNEVARIIQLTPNDQRFHNALRTLLNFIQEAP